MYCKHCGSQVPDGARFCMNCTAPIGEDTTGGYGTTNVQPSQIYQPQPSQRGRWREQNSQQYATSPNQYRVSEDGVFKNVAWSILKVILILNMIYVLYTFLMTITFGSEAIAGYITGLVAGLIIFGIIMYLCVFIYRSIRKSKGYTRDLNPPWYKKWTIWFLVFSMSQASGTVKNMGYDFSSPSTTVTDTTLPDVQVPGIQQTPKTTPKPVEVFNPADYQPYTSNLSRNPTANSGTKCYIQGKIEQALPGNYSNPDAYFLYHNGVVVCFYTNDGTRYLEGDNVKVYGVYMKDKEFIKGVSEVPYYSPYIQAVKVELY